MVLCSLIGGGFSSAMTPDLLAQWLLQEYGEAYKREVDKLTGRSLIGIPSIIASMNIKFLSAALINGELFLELPDDKELLEELKLSPAFKRLVIRKAKQVTLIARSSSMCWTFLIHFT